MITCKLQGAHEVRFCVCIKCINIEWVGSDEVKWILDISGLSGSKQNGAQVLFL